MKGYDTVTIDHHFVVSNRINVKRRVVNLRREWGKFTLDSCTEKKTVERDIQMPNAK